MLYVLDDISRYNYRHTRIHFLRLKSLRAWIRNHICCIVWDVITRHYHVLKDDTQVAKPHLIYRKVSNIRRTKFQNLNDLVLKSSLPNPLKPGVKSRMKM